MSQMTAKLGELLRKIKNRTTRHDPSKVELNYSDARAVERGGLPASDWTADQERPR